MVLAQLYIKCKNLKLVRTQTAYINSSTNCNSSPNIHSKIISISNITYFNNNNES